MSARRASVAIKSAARQDIRSILANTSKQWGAAQRDLYEAGIARAFDTLSANPRIGQVRNEISPGLRSYTVEQHVIYYRVSGGEVTVVRVLHGKMDASRHIEW